MFDFSKPIPNEVVFGTVAILVIGFVIAWQVLKKMSQEGVDYE